MCSEGGGGGGTAESRKQKAASDQASENITHLPGSIDQRIREGDPGSRRLRGVGDCRYKTGLLLKKRVVWGKSGDKVGGASRAV